MRNINT